MSEIIFNVFAVLFFISIFALVIFTRIKQNMKIARWFYLMFSLTLIPTMPKFMEDVEEKWLIIWPLLFVAAGIFMFAGITLSLKDDKKE